MKIDMIKKELIKRYKYIYENAEYILAPFVKHELSTHLKLPRYLLVDLESFLLSDIPIEESNFYKYLESKKKDLDYMNSVRNGIKLLNDKNSNLVPTYISMIEKLDS